MRYRSTCVALLVFLCAGAASHLIAKTSFTESKWFSNGFAPETFSFAYGGESRIKTVGGEENAADSVLRISLDDRTASGAEISLSANTLDLSDMRTTGALSFKVKGAAGGERFYIGLKDNAKSGKVQVKCKSENYLTVKSQWQEVSIPLSGFSDAGEKWIDEYNSPAYDHIDWESITAVVFSTQKDQNLSSSTGRMATLLIDDIKIIGNSATPAKPKMVPWKLRTEKVEGTKLESGDSTDILFYWLGEKLAPYTSAYTYGEPTDFRLIQSQNEKKSSVFAAYFSDSEWSGVTLNRGNSFAIDIKPYLKTGGVEFYVRGAEGGEVFAIGMIDDNSDGADKKVQSSVESRGYVKVTREWQVVKIPFSDFNDIGRWWDSDANQNVMSTIDWTKITELRFSTNKGANRHAREGENGPVALYFSDIRFVKEMDLFNREAYWESFKSDAPDKLLDDFENKNNIAGWRANIDSTSKMTISEGKNEENNSKSISIDYQMGAWGAASYVLKDSTMADWSRYGAIQFDFYSDKPIDKFTILVQDGGREAWSAFFEAKNGWQNVILPFSRFELFEHWQPEDAKTNRRIDLDRMYSYEFRPAHPGSKGTIMLDNVMLTNRSAVPKISSIRLNQQGYIEGMVKRFAVTDSAARKFSIVNEKGKSVFEGELEKGRVWDLSGEYVAIGDFTSLDKPGRYQLQVRETGEKTSVFIGKDIYKKAFDASIKAFYYQRAWQDLEPKHAGKWSRKKGTPDTACEYHPTTGKEGVGDVSGGWYDAGDYGKYVVNGGITVGTLLALYELFPDRMSDALNVPESGNGVPDILDEVRYELDWMKKMQDSDGGVFFKIGPLKWDGYVMPVDCESKRYVIGKSTTSALNFAAVTAMAGRVFEKVDKAYASDCLKRSEKAWQWAIKNPDVREPDEQGGSGAYSDSKFEDEFFWAACELYTTTQKKEYEQFIQKNSQINKMTTAANWQNVHNLGWFTIATHFEPESSKLAGIARNHIKKTADTFLAQMDSIPYRIPSNSFMWGSNSEQLNHGIVLAYAHRFTGSEKYLNAAVETCDYIFGKNAVGYSFVTGFGSRSSKWPHHRVMAADGIDEPLPGFVVGGPNNAMQDAQDPSVHYYHTEPARAYLDKVASYASNEIAINWNGALAFMLGYIQLSLE